VKAATSKPVSVKTRLGWSRSDEILEFARVIEAAGADLLSIHGRTKEQGYAGQANWEMIGRAKQLVTLPILVNGDIFSAEAATEALDITAGDGVLIARGALGNPWIFAEIETALSNKTGPDPKNKIDSATRSKIVLEHARLHADLSKNERPLVTFRKHLAWYYRGQPGAKAIRQNLMQVETVSDLEEILKNTI
ncbi:tRNA-dihydrouridine synthase, partial [Patescibacteria group bacterium]|nr:tRNA-dihydrouridine synthase [Patescibacteria group bacterium]